MIRRERRDGGEGEERGLRNRDREKRDKRELSSQFQEEDKEHRYLPLLVSSRWFLLSSRLDSAVKRSSSEVLKLSFQRSCSVKGLARRD